MTVAFWCPVGWPSTWVRLTFSSWLLGGKAIGVKSPSHLTTGDSIHLPWDADLGQLSMVAPVRFLHCKVTFSLVVFKGRTLFNLLSNRLPWEILTLIFGSPPGLWLTWGASVSMSTSALSSACPRSTWVQALRPACRRTPSILSICRENTSKNSVSSKR